MRLGLYLSILLTLAAPAAAGEVRVIDPGAKFPEGPLVENGILSLSETLCGWRREANRVMLTPDARCFHSVVVSAYQLVSLESAA